ncbi:MoxR family ATPase [Zooshikella marina]|uniref:AAA family ATPase n=1 Tax=Zooshikella ganghwensis TaxID=202772 RepID=UPI001BB05290|nr:MoxR family ATPase [Zooshikella ganghwensis]MBU2704898.1 MoxR family ATPase [Zooshikella ganghwensis]
MSSLNPEIFSKASEQVNAIRTEINKAVIGQESVVDQVLMTLLASGHVLIEGVPGLGKTLLVRALAACFGCKFGRIQFTPDLMPSDVTGHAIYDMKSEEFKIRRGPAFTNLLLADEINRAPAKTQAALLEVMQEKQITIEGRPLPLQPPFMVLATQNPIEQEGTYPLPEAELDRFMLKVSIDYPSLEAEKNLVSLVTTNKLSDVLDVSELQQVVSPEGVIQLQKVTAQVDVDDQVLDYAIRIIHATRAWQGLNHGAGPRGGIALIRVARARALLRGQHFVTPDDVKTVAPAALRHRLGLAAELEIEGLSVEEVLKNLLDSVAAPRS